jgi:hypothetical protein
MADFLCPHYDVPLTIKHVPERPEGSFCTVLSMNDNNVPVNNRNEWKNDGDDDDETNSSASYNSISRSNMGKLVNRCMYAIISD